MSLDRMCIVTGTESSAGATTMSLHPSSRDVEAGAFLHLKHELHPVIPAETFKSQYHNAVKHKTASEILRNKLGLLQREASQKSCDVADPSIPSASQPFAFRNDGNSLLPKIKDVFYTVGRKVHRIRRRDAGESAGAGMLLRSSSPDVLHMSPSLPTETMHKPDLEGDSASVEGSSRQSRLDNEPPSINGQALKHSGKISSLQRRRKLRYSCKMPEMSPLNVDKNADTQSAFCADATVPTTDVVSMAAGASNDSFRGPPSDTASDACSSQIASSDPSQVMVSPPSCLKKTERKIADIVSAGAGGTGVQVAVTSKQRVTLVASSTPGTCKGAVQCKLSGVTASCSDSNVKSADHASSSSQDHDGKFALDDSCKTETESLVVKATRSLLYQALEMAAVGNTKQASSVSSHETPIDGSADNTRCSEKKIVSDLVSASDQTSSISKMSQTVVKQHGEKPGAPRDQSYIKSLLNAHVQNRVAALNLAKKDSYSTFSGSTSYVKIKPKLQDCATKNEIGLDPKVAAVSSRLLKCNNVQLHLSVEADDQVYNQQPPLINTSRVSSALTSPEGVTQARVDLLASQIACMQRKDGDTYSSTSSEVAPQLSVTEDNSQSLLIVTDQGPVLFWGKDPKVMHAAKVHLSTVYSSIAGQLQDESHLATHKDKLPSKSWNETDSEVISNVKHSIKQEPEEGADCEGPRNFPPFCPSKQESEVKQEPELSDHSEVSPLSHPQEQEQVVTYAVPNISLIADASHDVKVRDNERLWKEDLELKSHRWLVVQTKSSECKIFKCTENEHGNSKMMDHSSHQILIPYCKTSMRAFEVYNAMKAHVEMVKIGSLLEHDKQIQQGDKEETKLLSGGKGGGVPKDTIPVCKERFGGGIVKKKRHECGKAAKQMEWVQSNVMAENSVLPSTSVMHEQDPLFHIKSVQGKCPRKRHSENGKEVSFKKRGRKKKNCDQTVGESSDLASPSREKFDIYVEVDESISGNDSFSLDVPASSKATLTEWCAHDQNMLEEPAEGGTQTEVEYLSSDQQGKDADAIVSGRMLMRGSIGKKGGLSRTSTKSKSACGLCKKLSCQTGGKSHTKQLMKHDGHEKRKRCERNERPEFGCQRCCFVGNSEQELKEHLALEHTGRPLYTCSECLLQFFNLDIFQKHQQRHQTGFQCSVCKMTFETDAVMQEHKYQQHVRPYYCPLCLCKLVGLCNLKEHLNSCLGAYKCCICPWNSRTVMEVKDHGRLRHDMELLVCSVCGLSFVSNTDHMAHTYVKEACSYPDIMDGDKLAAYMNSGKGIKHVG